MKNSIDNKLSSTLSLVAGALMVCMAGGATAYTDVPSVVAEDVDLFVDQGHVYVGRFDVPDEVGVGVEGYAFSFEGEPVALLRLKGGEKLFYGSFVNDEITSNVYGQVEALMSQGELKAEKPAHEPPVEAQEFLDNGFVYAQPFDLPEMLGNGEGHVFVEDGWPVTTVLPDGADHLIIAEPVKP